MRSKRWDAAWRGFWAILLLAALGAGGDPAAPWKAGTARVNITPETPLRMAGYAGRTAPASSKLTDLWVRALALEDPAGRRAVLLSADLCFVTHPMADAVCRRLEQSRKLPRDAVLLAVTHTHSGPQVDGDVAEVFFDLTAAERDGLKTSTRRLEDQFAEAAEAALDHLEPARLAWARGHATFAVNRRNNAEGKVPTLRAEGRLVGPVDYDVPVLIVRKPEGPVRAIVFSYACHATVLSASQWCGDYPGYAMSELQASFPQATALFVAGCGADQNPLPRRAQALAEGYGKELAQAVRSAVNGVQQPIEGRLVTALQHIDLSFAEVPTPQELQKHAEGKDAIRRRWARLLQKQLDAKRPLPTSYAYPVQVWQLGSGPILVALGGEVVVEYALRLKRELGPDRTWIAGYCNDVMGYIPSERVLGEGRYEGAGAMIVYGRPGPWKPGLENAIVKKVRELSEVKPAP